MPDATWKPHEKHGRLTMQSDLPDSVYAFPDGKLGIPIYQKLPVRETVEAQAEAEKGGVGKILLVA